MATDPLDVGSLVTAGAGEDWVPPPRARRWAMSTFTSATWRKPRRSTTAHSASIRRCGLIRAHSSSLPAAITIISGRTSGHQGHQPARTRPSSLAWELVVPDRRDAYDVAQRLRPGGHAVDDAPDGVRASDPGGAEVYVRSQERR